MKKMKWKLLLALIVLFASISTVSAGTMDVSTSDTFYFYPEHSPAASDGYYAAVVVDGTPYYLDDNEYDELCEYSVSFASGFIYQFQDTSTSQDIMMGHTRIATLKTQSEPLGDFEKPVDKEFSFSYTTGKVGFNNNAHIITNLYL